MIFLPGILKERVAIVTGGGTGIGRAIAIELAELGADVVVANFGLRAAPGLAHSAAARAGVINLTRTLALEWAKHNIRVNAVAPGVVMTEAALAATLIRPDAIESIERAIPLKRLGTPEDIAHVVTFLVSDAAAYITGETIAADGGNWHGHGLSFVAY